MEWISVNDELPTHDKNVLIFSESLICDNRFPCDDVTGKEREWYINRILLGRNYSGAKNSGLSNNEWMIEFGFRALWVRATYWMPIPEIPIESGENIDKYRVLLCKLQKALQEIVELKSVILEQINIDDKDKI